MVMEKRLLNISKATLVIIITGKLLEAFKINGSMAIHKYFFSADVQRMYILAEKRLMSSCIMIGMNKEK